MTITFDNELARLTEALQDANEAIEDASEEDAQPEDVAEAHWLACLFLDRYHALIHQLGPTDKVRLQHYFCLKAEQLRKKLGRFKSCYIMDGGDKDRPAGSNRL